MATFNIVLEVFNTKQNVCKSVLKKEGIKSLKAHSDSANLHPERDVVHLEGGVRVVQIHLQAGSLAADGWQDGCVV